MCPPGVDQTTRTTQQWHILAPTLQQRQAMVSDNVYSTPSAFMRGKAGSFDAFEKLAKPTRPQTTISLTRSDHVRSSSKMSAIERMPAEMLGMLFSHPDMTHKDAMALGMCSSTLWMQLLAHIEHDLKLSVAPWAGVPLLCSGTWLTNLPPAIYERFPEEKRLETQYQGQAGTWHGGRGRGRSYGTCPARIWNWYAVSDFEDASLCRWSQAWRDCAFGAQLPPFATSQWWQELTDTLAAYSPSYTGHRDWKLRNLTTQQYVRLTDQRPEDAKHSSPQLYVTGASWLSLDQALMLRICWGSMVDSSYDGTKTGRISKGCWAGHCFDVVADIEMPGNEWRDVTADLVVEGRDWECNGDHSELEERVGLLKGESGLAS